METKSNNYSLLMVLVPIICLIIVGTTGYLQYRKLTALNAEVVKTDAEIELWDKKLIEIKSLPASDRIAAVPLTTQEQPNFYNWLRLTASQSKVEMTKWTNVVAPPPPPVSQTDQSKEPKAPPPYPKGIGPLMSDVEVAGDYSHIRDFLYRLLGATRVVTLNGVKWARGDKWPQTKVTFSVTRYVYTEPTASHGGAN